MYEHSIAEFWLMGLVVCVGLPLLLSGGIAGVGILAFLLISLVGYGMIYILFCMALRIPVAQMLGLEQS